LNIVINVGEFLKFWKIQTDNGLEPGAVHAVQNAINGMQFASGDFQSQEGTPVMNVLLVDDDVTTLNLLERAMCKWGHDVAKAENGKEALKYIEKAQIDIVVSDWMMPAMNGLELCKKIRSMDSMGYVYFVLISARDTGVDIVHGLQSGADDYITKPLKLDELQARVSIGARIIKLERELNQKYLAIKRNYYQSIHMFVRLLETYNQELGGHSRRVGQLALQLANRHPGLKPEDYPIVEAGGLLHDIGMIGLPVALATKSIPEMTGDEKKAYHTHPEQGESILNQVDLLRPVARIVRMHHEQPNGRGFPDGLQGKQLPLTAMVVGAASIYDHLVHLKKIPLDQIPEHLQPNRGYQIASDLVDLLLAINLEKIDEEAKLTFCEIDIEELRDGMVLAADIRTRTGAFVMGSDTCIDAVLIEKLKHYHELGNISSNIFIEK
jgi:putative two-component system response regulator